MVQSSIAVFLLTFDQLKIAATSDRTGMAGHLTGCRCEIKTSGLHRIRDSDKGSTGINQKVLPDLGTLSKRLVCVHRYVHIYDMYST